MELQMGSLLPELNKPLRACESRLWSIYLDVCSLNECHAEAEFTYLNMEQKQSKGPWERSAEHLALSVWSNRG